MATTFTPCLTQILTTRLPQCLLPRIPDLVLARYKNAEGFAGNVEAMRTRVESEMCGSIKRALEAEGSPSQPVQQPSQVTSRAPQPARTQSSPDWGGEPVPNLSKMVKFNAVALADFDASQKQLAQINPFPDCSNLSLYHVFSLHAYCAFQGLRCQLP